MIGYLLDRLTRTRRPDRVISRADGARIFSIYRLFHIGAWSFVIHRFHAEDAPDCFHTHEALSFRLILSGGYVEEFADGRRRTWRPFGMGFVRVDDAHRIHAVLARRTWTLWAQGPKRAAVRLLGDGWGRAL